MKGLSSPKNSRKKHNKIRLNKNRKCRCKRESDGLEIEERMASNQKPREKKKNKKNKKSKGNEKRKKEEERRIARKERRIKKRLREALVTFRSVLKV